MEVKTGYPTEAEAREAIVHVGRRMYDHEYVVTNDGNISVRISPDTIVVTPTGISKGFMTPEMMVVMNLDGDILSQGDRGPSSEVKMHIRVFEENPSIGAVVHAHPIFATSYSIAGIALDQPILSEAMLQVGTLPVAHYAKPGTYDVPDSIAPFVNGYGGVLLSNHGALTWGSTLDEAFSRMEVTENYAHVSFVVRSLGGGRALSSEQVKGLSDLRKDMGLADVLMPAGADTITNDTDVLPKTTAFQGE
ncbi:MAG: class II aldolase/adducin family protein [Atopobiaceae bacterium]|nr:class II aldolase/adducin family protein [Atopobiaceae bacterium]MCI2172623.1 class II aldolase/adducin family protein [Atopobiaceae bacterium]MCI2206930.1 class II aldolase/adducin family protein [Atopobiaceae bacterium]